MKKKLLIVTLHLTVGGIQKSLISALKAIDYSKYEVTLYLRKNRTDLLPLVDKRVNIIVNKDNHHYYRKPLAIIYQILIAVLNSFGQKEKSKKYNALLSRKIAEYSIAYEKKTYFKNEEYDIAVSYAQGYVALFVQKCINAKKKILFFHTSTDDLHELHAEVLPYFDKAVALHQQQESEIIKWHPCLKGKTVIVENYTDSEAIALQSREFSVDRPESKAVLCSCGRFTPVKGFDLAVEAAKSLKEAGLQFLWYFVGDGPEREKLEGLIKQYKLQNEIILTGMQNNPYPYMAACDIYIQPSYEEALGLTMLEAHRLNKPVISTATMGGRKLIIPEVNGLLCDINAPAIAKAVLGLTSDEKGCSLMVSNLKGTNYSREFIKYKEQWKNLLEG